MQEAIRTAKAEAQRKAHLERLSRELREKGRVPFGDISRRIVRDQTIREWAIESLIQSGVAVIEVDFATGGAPRTCLVLKE